MRQPWFVANSRSSSSVISRRTRNSAGWVTTYSELIERLSPILAARAGKSLCICSGLAINRAIRVRNLFLQRQRWRRLGFTVESSPECVNSFAAGRRATRGWFLHIDLAPCRSVCVSAYVSNSPLGTSATTTISAHWRGAFPSLTSVDVFGDDRVTRSHH